jgi:exonuclease III
VRVKVATPTSCNKQVRDQIAKHIQTYSQWQSHLPSDWWVAGVVGREAKCKAANRCLPARTELMFYISTYCSWTPLWLWGGTPQAIIKIKGDKIFFRLGTLNVNSLIIARKRRNILRQLKSHCDVTCFQDSKLDGASANDVCKDDSGSWAFNNRTTKTGGVAIHLQDKLGQYTDDVEFNNVDGSVVGCSVEFNGYKLYLVSVYAPCCGKSKSRLAANMVILNEVEKLVISMKAKRHEVIVSGDLNFIRDDFLDADGGSPEIYNEQLEWIDRMAKYCLWYV